MRISKIIVVGGGPAGLMTAIALASEHPSLHITVIERNSWPVDKVCGEGIMPKGVEILKKYGVFSKINLQQLRAFNGIRYVDQSLSAEAKFKYGLGYVIRRTALSQALYDRACQLKNISLVSNIQLTDYHADESGVDVFTKDKNNSSEIHYGHFDLIVGCDGIRSKVRKLADLDAEPPMPKNRNGARVHYQIKPWTDKVEVHWRHGMECYIAPSSDNCVEFIFGWNKDIIDIHKVAGMNLEERLFACFPDLQMKIKNARKLSKFNAMASLATASASPVKDRIVLLGDAAMFCDPITGEGMSMAFEQAEILSQHIAKIDMKAGQEEYASRILKRTKQYEVLTRAAVMLSNYPVIRRLVMRIFRRFPWLFQYALEQNMGNKKLSYGSPFLIKKLENFCSIIF